MQLIWEEFLKIIKEEAGTQVVETWFRSVSLDTWDVVSKTAILRMPNSFILSWVQEHYSDLIKQHLSRLFNVDNLKLIFLQKSETTAVPQKPFPISPIIPARTVTVTSNNTALRKKKENYGRLNDGLTFNSFVVGPSNVLAHAAAYSVSQNLSAIYNPLFICGGTGLGKTHLLHAIGNEIKRKEPSINVCYESSDQFMHEFVSSVRAERTRQFREKYNKVDLLLLDDVQFFSSREQTQEIFFHIFNALHNQNKQIVFSSDKLPTDIASLQHRLRSRLQSGLVASLETPTYETRMAILKNKATLHSIDINDEVGQFIASRPVSNVRELEGYLIKLAATTSITKQPISLDLVRQLLTESQEPKVDVTLESIMKMVSKQYCVSAVEIRSPSRSKNIAFARSVAVYLMKKYSMYSLQSIGTYVGGRDHTTVLHSVKKIEGLMAQDVRIASQIKNIEQMLYH